MKLRILASVLSLLLVSLTAKSQDSTVTKPSGLDIGLEGMIGFSVGEDFYSLNVGGPSLFLNLNKHWKIGVGALPSLYLLNGKLGARLGVSPRIDHKNLVLIAPFFHKDSSGEWIWSLGLGYKFHKK